MAEANRPYLFAFIDVSGQTLTNYIIDVFTVGGQPVDAATNASLTLTEVMVVGIESYYQMSFTPSVSGNYFIGGSNGGSPVFADAVDVDEANFVLLTQDTPTAGALKPKLPSTIKFSTVGNPTAKIPGLETYLLLVFHSEDWNLGKTATSFAVASVGLDAEGNWLASPLTVVPGTYTVVIRNNYGTTKVVKADLVV